MNIINSMNINYPKQTPNYNNQNKITCKKKNTFNCTNSDLYFGSVSYYRPKDLPENILDRYKNVTTEFYTIIAGKTQVDKKIKNLITFYIMDDYTIPNIKLLKDILITIIKNDLTENKNVKKLKVKNNKSIYSPKERAFAIDTFGKIYLTQNDEKILLAILDDPREKNNTAVIAKTIEVLGKNYGRVINVVKSTNTKKVIANSNLKIKIRAFSEDKNEDIRTAAKNALEYFKDLDVTLTEYEEKIRSNNGSTAASTDSTVQSKGGNSSPPPVYRAGKLGFRY